MAVPKKKTSKSKRNLRRSHDALKKINIAFDSTTGEAKLPHHISPDGFYKGVKILDKSPKKKASDSESQSESSDK